MKYIALVIRGKHSEAHDPELLEQHADVVLSTGMPIGFFGSGGGSLAGMGLGMDGVVADFDIMAQIRPAYVDADLAATHNVQSTICILGVSDHQAKTFDAFWTKPTPAISKEMRGFSILGDNCSTAASMAFRHAGILPEGIPGLDTPNNLFEQLRFTYGSNFSCTSGYVGFEKHGTSYKAVVK